jgi:hypothetical protein
MSCFYLITKNLFKNGPLATAFIGGTLKARTFKFMISQQVWHLLNLSGINIKTGRIKA